MERSKYLTATKDPQFAERDARAEHNRQELERMTRADLLGMMRCGAVVGDGKGGMMRANEMEDADLRSFILALMGGE